MQDKLRKLPGDDVDMLVTVGVLVAGLAFLAYKYLALSAETEKTFKKHDEGIQNEGAGRSPLEASNSMPPPAKGPRISAETKTKIASSERSPQSTAAKITGEGRASEASNMAPRPRIDPFIPQINEPESALKPPMASASTSSPLYAARSTGNGVEAEKAQGEGSNMQPQINLFTPQINEPKSSPMPPPPKPIRPANLNPPPSAASALRGPTKLAPSTLAPTLSPSTSTLSPSARPSKKVLLEPGHSPLDWAHLTANPPTPTFLRGADIPPTLIKVPPSMLKYYNGRKDKQGKKKDAWGVYQGKVYNMTPYMDFHPGGADQLMRGAGKETAEKLFNEIHPWVSWENMLGECLVGILVSENEIGGMEDMD